MGRPTTYRNMTTTWTKDGYLSNMGSKYYYIRRTINGDVYEKYSSSGSCYITLDGSRILKEGNLTFICILDK